MQKTCSSPGPPGVLQKRMVSTPGLRILGLLLSIHIQSVHAIRDFRRKFEHERHGPGMGYSTPPAEAMRWSRSLLQGNS